MKPIVSVCCVTYNHENFIKDCIDGLIEQKTDFDYEILIHDDASADNTTAIVREYEKKYPELIKVIYQTENQFLKQNVLFNILIPMAKGKYIALCEGDDYWTDPLKLQKQVDAMETNPMYSICGHETIMKFRDIENRKVSLHFSIPVKNHFSQEDLIIYAPPFHTSSVLFRKSVFDLNLFLKYNSHTPAGDILLCAIMAKKGPGIFLMDTMSVYNWTGAGLTTKMINENFRKDQLQRIDFYHKIRKEFPKKFQVTFDKVIFKIFDKILFSSKGKLKEIPNLFKFLFSTKFGKKTIAYKVKYIVKYYLS